MIVTIKKYSEIPDIDKLCQIVSKHMDFIGSKKNMENINDTIKNALKDDTKAIFFLNINEKKDICGFAFGNISSGLETGADYFWLNELYVESEHRRKKIATEIVTFMENWAEENNIKYIAAMTDKSNKNAAEFYKKMGYEVGEVLWVDKRISKQ